MKYSIDTLPSFDKKFKKLAKNARVITYTAIVNVEEGVITLLTIYDKAEQDTISNQEISILLKELESE